MHTLFYDMVQKRLGDHEEIEGPENASPPPDVVGRPIRGLADQPWYQPRDGTTRNPGATQGSRLGVPATTEQQQKLHFKHLPFNDFDMAGVTSAVTRYKSAGLCSDYNIEQKNEGIVRIRFENPVRKDGSFAIFELHKLARRGLLRKKAHWVVQMHSQRDGAAPTVPHGCAWGSIQAKALSEAEIDLKHNFLSIVSFEMAAEAN